MFKSARLAILPAVRRFAQDFAEDEGGATAIEYALIASGISIAIVGVVVTLGSNLTSLYGSVASALK